VAVCRLVSTQRATFGFSKITSS